LINRAWRNFSISLFPLNPLPDRELPGFWSIHTVNSTSWAWYSLTCPIANLTNTDHRMEVFFWSGATPLSVDGIEFASPQAKYV
jgi:hypothetical protein